ncbi:asparagine synthase (glutamine-hydrolyzing) [Winogradskyella maritima]|uniref:asparagine synthase (glutamine-hydrolyzing) n=1 Tax=Winogradskyella maritima TaxID=1517766 RepID=A0ABV8AGU0_9FLAO|nr:asparagine synthase (glutamine-hydrolyzing) [Winogradskyella maritima]
MCGFLAEFCFNNIGITSPEHFGDLLRISKHRGPDDTQTIRHDNFQLGFNRLSILDLSTNGSQPKESPSGRYLTVFNGEIYNYQSLASAFNLQALRSTSDTEVLVHLLDGLGVEETLCRLDGMFALTIIDRKTNQCYMARDFAGIKPLFYGISPLGLVSASQFNQVFKHPWFKKELSLRPDTMKAYFGFGYMPSPDTVFDNIYQVEPGQYIIVENNGTIRKKYVERFDDLNFRSDETYSEILNQTIKEQMTADVPLGTFLSGGIDSPLITATAFQKDKTIEAFTFKAEDALMDESQIAMAYAEHIGIAHQVIKVSFEDVKGIVDFTFDKMSEPLGDYSTIPTYLVTNRASKSKTVMLSGDGGDELFFGYPRFLHVMNHRHWFKLPFKIRRPLARIALKFNLLKSWGPYQYRTVGQWVMSKQIHIDEQILNDMIPEVNWSQAVKTLYEYKSTKKQNLLGWLRRNEFFGHLQRVLAKVDRMSMANSLEVRVPFLSKQSIYYAFGWMPKSFKKNIHLKQKLKTILATHVPQILISQTKKGFTIPIEDWLKGPLSEDVHKLLLTDTFYGAQLIEKAVIETYVNDFYAEKHNSSWGIWHLYAWQKWAIKEGLI